MNLRNLVPAIKRNVGITEVLNLSTKYVLEPGVERQIHCIGHSEERPSARVYPDTNLVYCWVCHKAWDVVGAYQILFDVSFKHAVEELAVKFNVAEDAAPDVINRFYAQVDSYKTGTSTDIKIALHRVSNDFKKYYESIYGYKHMSDAIDYMWHKYETISTSIVRDAEVYKRISDWYYDAIRLVEHYRETCKFAEDVAQNPQNFFK